MSLVYFGERSQTIFLLFLKKNNLPRNKVTSVESFLCDNFQLECLRKIFIQDESLNHKKALPWSQPNVDILSFAIT